MQQDNKGLHKHNKHDSSKKQIAVIIIIEFLCNNFVTGNERIKVFTYCSTCTHNSLGHTNLIISLTAFFGPHGVGNE
jgi:hypothetical protein